ncbi:MAG: zinc ribbon domain-containing protein [Actinomycetota bacterium]
MIVCVCGTESPDDARYCRQCGRPLAPGTAAEAGDGPLLAVTPDLDLTPGGIETEATVVKGNAGTRFWVGVAAVVGVVMVAAVAWATFGIADAPGAPADDATSPTGPSPGVEGDDGVDEDAADGDSARTAATAGDEPSVLGADGVTIDGDYDIVVAAQGQLTVVSLVDGSVRSHRGAGFEPVAATADWLLVQRNDGVFKLPIADLGAVPVRLGDVDRGFQMLVGLDTDEAWILTMTSFEDAVAEETLERVDLNTGAVDTAFADTVEISDFFAGLVQLGPGTPLLSRAGGVYELAPGGVARVAEGRLLAADADRVLVERCDDGLRCDKVWLGRSDWAPVDLATPEVPGQRELLGNTGWLLSFEAVTGRGIELLDIETGRAVSLDDERPRGTGGIDSLPRVSPDGRWLVASSFAERRILLRNLYDDTLVELPLDVSVTSPAVFIERR